MQCWISVGLCRLAAQGSPAQLQRPASGTAFRRSSRSWGTLHTCAAQGGDSEASTPGMTVSDAYKQLGVKAGASFEECLKAKNSLLARYDGDKEKCMQVEAAYDLLFMQQMSARLRGEIPVSSKVRFADVPQRRPPPPKTSKPAPNINFPVSVFTPRGNDLTIQAAVFGGLAAWVLIQDLAQPASGGAGAADIPGVQMALGLAATVYFMREQKRVGLGKAAGLAVGGLVAGTLLGSLVENWLRVDIVPLGGIDAPGTVVGEFALAGLAAVSLLLA